MPILQPENSISRENQGGNKERVKELSALTIQFQVGFGRLWPKNKGRGDNCESGPEEEYHDKGSPIHFS